MRKETANALADVLQELAKSCNDLSARLDHAERMWKAKDSLSYQQYQAQLGIARNKGVPVVVGKSVDKLRSALLQDQS
jgi:hypothetical protein